MRLGDWLWTTIDSLFLLGKRIDLNYANLDLIKSVEMKMIGEPIPNLKNGFGRKNPSMNLKGFYFPSAKVPLRQ